MVHQSRVARILNLEMIVGQVLVIEVGKHGERHEDDGHCGQCSLMRRRFS